MIARVALVALALLIAAPASALAQTGGIQVAPVMVTLTQERGISSVRVRNTRDRAVSFEIDAYAWTQENGGDVLTATDALIVAPGVFEIPAGGEQVVRLGVRVRDVAQEQAYRIVMRELPSARADGVTLGFTLEMSLPVFLTAAHARPQVNAEASPDGQMLALTNSGAAHAQIASIEDQSGQAMPNPRYLLAGSSMSVPLSADATAVHLRLSDASGQTERVVHVPRSDTRASVR